MTTFSKIENGQILESRQAGVFYPRIESLVIGGSKLAQPDTGYTEQHYRDAGWYELIPAVVSDTQVQLATFTQTENPKTYTYDVRDKTQQELALELGLNLISMAQAADEYLMRGGQPIGYVSPSALAMIELKADKNKQKSKENRTWADSVWTLYYAREADLKAGNISWSEDLMDYSSCGEMPHSIKECKDE